MIPKFKAYNPANNKWYNSEEVFVCDGKIYLNDDDFEELTQNNDVELMQSTGLFDTYCRNELFEDDIILWTYFDEWEDSGNARIVYRDGCWKLLDVKTDKEVWDTLFDCLENCSVYLAGNIYENPELVEG